MVESKSFKMISLMLVCVLVSCDLHFQTDSMNKVAGVPSSSEDENERFVGGMGLGLSACSVVTTLPAQAIDYS